MSKIAMVRKFLEDQYDITPVKQECSEFTGRLWLYYDVADEDGFMAKVDMAFSAMGGPDWPEYFMGCSSPIYKNTLRVACCDGVPGYAIYETMVGYYD